jgi:hypothetical protein
MHITYEARSRATALGTYEHRGHHVDLEHLAELGHVGFLEGDRVEEIDAGVLASQRVSRD